MLINKRWKPNYQYMIKSTIQVEGRLSYIKNLRAMALYLEDETTDEDFHLMALKEKPMPELNTYKINDIESI